LAAPIETAASSLLAVVFLKVILNGSRGKDLSNYMRFKNNLDAKQKLWERKCRSVVL